MDNKTKDSVINFFKRTPGDAYFRFLTDEKHLLTDPNRANGREDPFALSLINRNLAEYYFPRGDLEARVRQWSNQVIVGRRASGKTTLLRKVADPVSGPKEKLAGAADGQPAQSEPDAGQGGERPVDLEDLVVTIPLQRSDEMVPDEAFFEKRAPSPLSIPVLSRYIMDGYFTSFICPPVEQAGLLGYYRKKQGWMEALCWAYNNFPPLRPTLEADFELMAWLGPCQYESLARRVTWPRTDLEKFEHLIRFITSPLESLIGGEPWRYRRVVVLVDGAEELPPLAVERLLDDYARLVDYGFANLCVKLFIDRRDEGRVHALEPVRQGLVDVVEMPHWSEDDLKKLLLIRPLICTGQAPDKSWEEIGVNELENSIRYDWTWKFFPHVLRQETRKDFLNKLIAAARRAYDGDEVYDPPYHALRLTQGVLWYASTLAAKDSGPKEIEMKNVDEICDLYWSGR